MARPAKHDERTRAAVLDAAEELLADGGVDAVTVRAVADRIGESTRAVYSQFSSMSDLMAALGARGFLLVADLVNAVPVTDDPLRDLVEVGASGFREFAITRPQLFRITFHEISDHHFSWRYESSRDAGAEDPVWREVVRIRCDR